MFSDPRSYQILFLSLFLVLGIGTRDWTLHPEIILTAIATCLTVQTFWVWIIEHRKTLGEKQKAADATEGLGQKDSKPAFILHPSSFSLSLFPPSPFPLPPLPLSSLPSAVITSLGLSLLLRTEHISTMVLAGAIAISSKFLLKINDKHLFNPANIGIVAAILLTHDAWISPGQWGEESWYALLFLGTGGIVVHRVGRWDTTGAFLGCYAGLEAARNLWLGWTWDVWLHRLSSGSLLLFALFMVTDPRTIPNARVARLLWASAIALLAFLLRNLLFLPTAVFWALFILSPLTLLLDWLWTAPRFVWTTAAEEVASEV